MPELAEAFLLSVRKLLEQGGMEDEYDDFLRAYTDPAAKALRVNSLKRYGAEELIDVISRIIRFENGNDESARFEPVPWSDDGYAIKGDFRPGLSIANRLGLYYIQEPSAMLPAEALSVEAGQSVIDLCAAPGGKSARIAADLNGSGLLLSNDISSSRGRVLVRNLEQLGVGNCIVTAADPVILAEKWPCGFDRVLVDAPCSGEGMFRRDPKAISSWNQYGPDTILPIQEKILDAAYRLLKCGGLMVYSTCTFNRQENEEQIEKLMARYPALRLLPLPQTVREGHGIDSGIRAGNSIADIEMTGRIWPWRSPGEGHFCALLEKTGTDGELPSESLPPAKGQLKSIYSASQESGDALEAVQAFYRDVLSDRAWWQFNEALHKRFRFSYGKAHLVPENAPDLSGVHVLKDGIYLGDWIQAKRKNRFVPSHSAVLTCQETDFRDDRTLKLRMNDERVQKITRGETVALTEMEYGQLWPAVNSAAKGYIVVVVEQFPLTWLKLDPGGAVKNLYPRGWIT